jgi:hypothetical protein
MQLVKLAVCRFTQGVLQVRLHFIDSSAQVYCSMINQLADLVWAVIYYPRLESHLDVIFQRFSNMSRSMCTVNELILLKRYLLLIMTTSQVFKNASDTLKLRKLLS